MSEERDEITFGLYLNMGANLAPTPEEVFAFTRRQARAAEAAGYHDLWVTEHHFIRFGINPSALNCASFLLGLTERVRVGTAVALSPLYRRVDLAEQACLLDQLSEGRFDLGIGRGGYVRDYAPLGVDTARWDEEPDATIDALVDLWNGGPVDAADPDFGVQPPPRAAGHPNLFVATSSERALKRAAAGGFPLQHYFASPAAARLAVEERYVAFGGDPAARHMHALIVIVSDDPAADRERLTAALTQSFLAGDHPAVPQQPERHLGPDGKPFERGAMAAMVAQGALVGPPTQIVDELGAFIDDTGARRIVLYQESIADEGRTMHSIERFAAEVAPQLGAAPGGTS